MASPAVLTLPMLDDRPGRTWSAQVPIRCGCCLVPILALRARSTVTCCGSSVGSLDACSQRGRERHAAPPRHVGVCQEREGHQRDTGGPVCVKLRFQTQLAHSRSARLGQSPHHPHSTPGYSFKPVVARSGRPQSGLLVASHSACAILTCLLLLWQAITRAAFAKLSESVHMSDVA
jgi:hypothetical protein